MEQETRTQEDSKFDFSKNAFGYVGLGLALIGAIVLFYESNVMDFFQPKKERTVVEKVLDIVINEPEEAPAPKEPFSTTAIVLGFSGLMLSLIAMGRKESKGLSWMATSLSVGVLSWQLILAYVLSQVLPIIAFVLILMLIGMFVTGGGF